MSIPLPFLTQYECRNETLEVYASDRRGEISYSFNNYGYRNNIDYNETETNAGIYVGSSITSGIGIDWTSSFAWLSSEQLGVKCYHFSQGCMPVDNQEILRVLSTIKKHSSLTPNYFVIQFIGLDRRYNIDTGFVGYEQDATKNIALFQQIFVEIEDLLKNDTWCFIGSDGSNTVLPDSIKKHSKCAGWNYPMVDYAGVTNHPGKKWHLVMSKSIVNKLKKT